MLNHVHDAEGIALASWDPREVPKRYYEVFSPCEDVGNVPSPINRDQTYETTPVYDDYHEESLKYQSLV